MKVSQTSLPGVLVIEPRVFGDNRGYFHELWKSSAYKENGLDVDFVQANVSSSARGVLRGLHFQYPMPQGKLVSVLSGSVFDAAVDIRQGSPTFKQWYACELSEDNHRQLYIPEGFAHGFCVLSEQATLTYLCTREYRQEYDMSVAWDDPEIAVDWPLQPKELSAKDRDAARLADIDSRRLPVYQES